MASIEDLVATVSGVHVGQHGADLKDLQAKLHHALLPTIPTYRNPVPLPVPNTTSAPLPPPAPVSSWNSPAPNCPYLHSFHPTHASLPPHPTPLPHSQPQPPKTQRETGFVPSTNQSGGTSTHKDPKGSPTGTGTTSSSLGGFVDDAFRPLWASTVPAKGFK
ncbi:hypothetical protein TREMEDRAFT_59869 [Tremella mesenterica DSM 1558]|uniref:uncharacterized protein n=1 Tax=Tremella mesenterica (strain ATCC 24925 / CBS 8224 / DSM 1558 / NBRC 9311 / NRRL Y-6157 / RJB 2259-6 / UBC 559-6) TaxID=578456 RepID=UPI0003F49CB9|nr:uncharacterized protein TREMEDRAFT_59869 [Tremella mesenterica DSM 1558]EIW73695.1 hypothetical protein TREMEDRAFT_59869 [Tremella mesenterica DSM 1558]